MQIPNFPTDSLYKFISLSGLFLLVGLLLGPEYAKYKIDIHQLAIDTENAQARLRVDFNTDDIDKLESALAKAEKNQKNISEEDIKLLEKTSVVNRENRLLLAGLHGKLRLSMYYSLQLERVKKFQLYGILTSLIYTLLGFVLWYLKVQKPMDFELKRGSDSKK